MSAPMVAEKLRRLDRGALLGFFDLTITGWHLTLRDCKWFRKDGKEWVGLPQSSFAGKDGKVIYKDLVEIIDKDVLARFQDAALAAVRTASDGARRAA